MYVSKKSVDLNAYIVNLNYEIKTVNDKKQLVVSFENLGYGTITAIRLVLCAKDSFGDNIIFNGKESLDIKKSDLSIKPHKKAGFTCDLDDCDIKDVVVSVSQIVYDGGNIVNPMEPEIVEYEVEALSSTWSPNEHFEKDALDYMREKNSSAICFPRVHEKGWICVCGGLNRDQYNSCGYCGADRERQFRDYSIEVVKEEIAKRDEKKRIEEEQRRERQRLEREAAEKKQKMITIGVVSAVILAIVLLIASVIVHNIKYGLSDEETASYNVAQSNYKEIDYFVMKLGNKYSNVAEKYHDSSYSSNRKSKLSEAEKDKDYLYARGMYLGSTLLYELIEDQYPQKYHKAYEQLIKLQKGYVFNQYLSRETLYVVQSSASNYIEQRDAIKAAIDGMEKYMGNETLNPAKVELKTAKMPSADYSKVYGINLGIIIDTDGSILYIGEYSNGVANGFGKFHYVDSEGNKSYCEGTFEKGVFIEDSEGKKIDGVPNVTGEFVAVKGLKNTASSESVANKAAADENRDRERAKSECERYLNAVLEKQKGITNIEWRTSPEVSGNYYYFSCTVEDGGLTRKGTITVKKQSDGSFVAEGMEYNN